MRHPHVDFFFSHFSLNFFCLKTLFRTIAVTSFGSMEIAKLHSCDLFKQEHEDGSFESHQDLTGTIWNVFAFASSACNTVHLTLLVGHKCICVSPPRRSTPFPAHAFGASILARQGALPVCKWPTELGNLSLLILSPAWVKWTTDPSFYQLLISGLLSITQPGRNSKNWQAVSVT